MLIEPLASSDDPLPWQKADILTSTSVVDYPVRDHFSIKQLHY